MGEFVYGHIDDIPNHVTDLTDNGKCTECGACCSSLLPVSKAEIDTIARYVKKHSVKPYVDRGPIANVEFDLTCPFLDRGKRTHKCRIYPVRPFICQLFSCHEEMDLVKAMKVKNHYASGDVDIVNMRDLFGHV